MNAHSRDTGAHRTHPAQNDLGAAHTMRVLAVVLVVCCAAVAAILQLQRNADRSTHAQASLAAIEADVRSLQDAPFQANPTSGGSPELARHLLLQYEGHARAALAGLRSDAPPAELAPVGAELRAYAATLHRIYLAGISPTGYDARADRLGAVAIGQRDAILRKLAGAGRVYARRASSAHTQATAGAAAVMVALFCGFALFYRRSAAARRTLERLARADELALASSREEALTDPLTGLRNRRALIDDLTTAVEGGAPEPTALVLFDLDGFKQYNDTFGHPAGDVLLARMGERLRTAAAPAATAYRMGGDEFCVLAPAGDHEEVVWRAFTALTERTDTVEVSASYGIACVPEDVTTVEGALRLADMRLYQDKAAGRQSAGRQSTDVLLELVHVRAPKLHAHLLAVSRLSELTARAMGLSDHEARRTALAAALHDIGRAALADAIVEKPCALDADEWTVMHRHTLIGERIVRAAPALEHTGALVRASHEWFDGSGYPDGLAGDRIPIGARIIAVCDAYDTMTTDRPYRAVLGEAEALEELRRGAGAQFDPRVVDAFCTYVPQELGRRLPRAA